MPPEHQAVLDRPQTAPSKRENTDQPIDQCNLSVVIVNWNTRHVIGDCLASVLTNLGALDAEIIVIDNASTDGSAEFIAREFPAVKLIVNEVNRGFAAGNNQGMRIARADFILLLNPDTVVLDDVLEKTMKYAGREPGAAVIGCQVMESETAVQRTCFRYPSPLNTFLWVSGLRALFPRSRFAGRAAYGPWNRNTVREVDVISGMFMLVRRKAIEEVGLMDEDYFVFAEEADWCRRFWKAGWRCVFAPVGRILHVDGGSKSTEQARVKMYVEMQKNLLLFQRKQLGPLSGTLTRMLFATSMALQTLWWWSASRLGLGSVSPLKARQCAAATVYHWTGREPQ